MRPVQSEILDVVVMSDDLPCILRRGNVVSEQVDVPINERALRLGPGWDLDPSYLAGVSNYRDWNDVLGDLKNFVNKPLNLVKRWFWAK
jgi:hypothetical protein